MRKAVADRLQEKSEFRLRGESPGRLENFSDAIFALAITFLLISNDPPETFQEIKRMLIDLIPFMFCMVLFTMIWYEHTVFFLRYGLRNGTVVVINTIFLFLVLFFVHPLRFLTQLIELPIAMVIGNDELKMEVAKRINGEDIGQLMAMYGFGAASVFLILAAFYHSALKQREELELTEMEAFDTRGRRTMNLLMASVPIASALLALVLIDNQWAGMLCGMMYILYTPVMFIWGSQEKRRREKLMNQLNSQEAD